MRKKNFKIQLPKTMFRFYLDFFANLFFVYCLIIGLALIMFSSVTMECVVIGSSMVPTYNNYSYIEGKKDIVFVNTRDRDYVYGDIVVCDSGSEDIIKRVIGVAGDIIDIVWDGYEYKVELNGKIIEENYINYENDPRLAIEDRNGIKNTYSKFQTLKESKKELFNESGKLIVPNNSIFVLGDNRHVSVDSSSIGTFDLSKVQGTVEHVKYNDDSEFAFYYNYIIEGKFIKTIENML